MWKKWVSSFFYDVDTTDVTPRSPDCVSKTPGYSRRSSSGDTFDESMTTSDIVRHREGLCPPSPGCPPSSTERIFCEQRLARLRSLDVNAQVLIRELWTIVTGEDEFADIDDDSATTIERQPGYDKSDEQRREDCERACAILAQRNAGVHANLTWTYGESLLWMAIEYDHQHPPQMLDVLLKAGADPSTPNEIDGLLPCEHPLLAEESDTQRKQKLDRLSCRHLASERPLVLPSALLM